MARVVAIHGAFHELWGPNEVRSRWLPAVRDGLWHHDVTLADDDLAIAFYGDLFRHAPDDPFAAESIEGIVSDMGLADVLDQAAGPGGIEAISKAMGEEMMRRTLDQVARYLAQPATRRAVRARLEAAVTDDTRVVVAHSLGTVVAYETLCAHPEWGVEALVTVGSPLGNLPFVFDHLDPAPVDGVGAWPGPIRHWTNVAALHDLACGEGRLAPRFGERVTDARVDNGHRAHDPEPYLNAAVTGAAIAAALA